MKKEELKYYLNSVYNEVNPKNFIEKDPICIPHKFKKKKDVEIAAFIASLFAWGNREMAILKTQNLMDRLYNAPFNCIMKSSLKNMKSRLKGFKHRTINEKNIFDILSFFKLYYSKNDSLENMFLPHAEIEQGIIHFRNTFIEKVHPLKETLRHLPSPVNNSACKRMLLFLKWMVRKDALGIDFGIWKKIKMSQLIIPLDIHVLRASKYLGLIHIKSYPSWKKAFHITQNLKSLCAEDPVKYDIALFTISKQFNLK